jgi:hypothetical protein
MAIPTGGSFFLGGESDFDKTITTTKRNQTQRIETVVIRNSLTSDSPLGIEALVVIL